MRIRETTGEKVFRIVNVFIMLFLVFISIYPFWYVLVCSLSDSTRIVGNKGFILWPKGFSLSSYIAVIKNPDIASGYMNTLIILVCGTTLNIFLTSLGAYVVTRKKFRLAKPMSVMMIVTMYFSGGMIPLYLVVMNILHLGNTLMSVLLPTAISTYNLIILRTNFAAIPESLEEAATIDGANDLKIFWRIVLPLSIPAIAVLVLFYGVSHWNSWFNAMLYLDNRKLYPLQLILREILITGNTDNMSAGMDADHYNIGESIRYATIIVATVPILVVYPFIQKYFVKGMMVGAVKG